MPLKTPCFCWGEGQTLFPGVDDEGLLTPRAPEKRSHIAASGATMTYYIGPRHFTEVTFRWQSETLRSEWIDFWDIIEDGTEFYYIEDSHMPLCGGGAKCGDGSKCGTHTSDDSTAITTTLMTVDQDEFSPDREDVEGYYSIRLRMREYV